MYELYSLLILATKLDMVGGLRAISSVWESLEEVLEWDI